MTSLAAPVVLAAGAALVLFVPLIALKELLEKRTQKNFKRHLGRRHICSESITHLNRYCFICEGKNFAKLDVNGKETSTTSKHAGLQVSPNGGKQSQTSLLPPTYDELFHPPPPYCTN
ncbi:hypothetical protein DICVIV_11563 [Dictyocaulus viviparus]|uniref:Uncharacterized protein n=1 Tax=Dictyocaulus viviparus TaxID=29172 RepID=A0A0D8XFD0_DICVI|nr:hypothetical protein DICVIV_11563 [Dictyocaulus viviparus]